jgi:hypothetical protein
MDSEVRKAKKSEHPGVRAIIIDISVLLVIEIGFRSPSPPLPLEQDIVVKVCPTFNGSSSAPTIYKVYLNCLEIQLGGVKESRRRSLLSLEARCL